MPDLLVTVALVSLGATLLTYATVFRCLRRRAAGAPCPPVSILKPLKGHDDGLFGNLASFAELDYPRFEILFGVEDPDDPAVGVARRVQRAYPHVDIRVVLGAPAIGLNPKVNNLASLSRGARYPFWLISDSNTRVRRRYLRETVASFGDPEVGLVTSVFAGTGEASAGALLENLHLNSFVASGMCGRQTALGRALVIGKSMLFRRRDLEALGGWESVADILAEDYVLGLRFAEAGFKVATSRHVIETRNERWGVRRFLNRHVRWSQIRRRIAPVAYFFEPLLNPVLWAALLLAAGRPWLALSITLAKIAADDVLAWRLRGHGYRWRHLAWIPLKDLVVAALWLVGAFRRRVWWRGNVLRIGPGTRLVGAASRRVSAQEPVPQEA